MRTVADPPSRARRCVLPPAPAGERVEADIGGEVPGVLGFVLWRLARDVKLWGSTEPEARTALFGAPLPEERRWLADAARAAPEVADALELLFVLARFPHLCERERVALACRRVSEWAAAGRRVETAVQFAEAAALADPGDPRAASAAGQACQHAADTARAVAWYQRAIVLARRVPDWECYVRAHLRLGYLALETGGVEAARPLYERAWRTARRTGRKFLGALAQHDLFGIAVLRGDHAGAVAHALRALELYPIYHPRFARFALDYAFMLVGLGMHPRARQVLEAAEPLWSPDSVRLSGLAKLALVCGRMGDRAGYEAASARAAALLAVTEEFAAAALVHLADGARSLGRWTEAEALVARAVEVARRRAEWDVEPLATGLMDQVATRDAGVAVAELEDPGEIHWMTREVLRRLRKQRART